MVAAVAGSSSAQLVPGQVLVVYDARIPDSLAVAEYYAGSAKVPGGAGNLPGVRPGVLTVNLASLPSGGLGVAQADVSYAQFKSNFRDPLRTYLVSRRLAGVVRCIVLTKGLPHRVQDIGAGAVGDNPGQAGNQFSAGVATYASLDSELTLLHQDLDAGSLAIAGASPAHGMTSNPYWRLNLPIAGYNTRNITTPKIFVNVPGFTGQIQRTSVGPEQNTPTALTRGDFYLVTRLDGRTVANVRAAIDRAQDLVVDVDNAVFVLDNDGRGFDNQGPGQVNSGADYLQTSSALTSDARFAAANVRFNDLGGVSNFLVGPLVQFGNPAEGLVVNGPLVLLASVGANANGVPTGAATTYASSFTYARGAVFNSIESYNGRDFNGLGQNVFAAQQQAADFLIAGGTFAVVNVWEPFAWSIPDNRFIVNSFFLGNLTWGEAAYTALPVLSWQQIVVGDPLARVVRSREDIDNDGRMTPNDLYAWQGSPRDINRDSTINDTDYRLVEASVRAFELATAKGAQR